MHVLLVRLCLLRYVTDDVEHIVMFTVDVEPNATVALLGAGI